VRADVVGGVQWMQTIAAERQRPASSRCNGVRVHVNTDVCDGHAECTLAAPEVFELRDGDNAVTLLMAEVGDDLRDRVLEAAEACPVRAITIDPADTHAGGRDDG
jgi:ferredoxin